VSVAKTSCSSLTTNDNINPIIVHILFSFSLLKRLTDIVWPAIALDIRAELDRIRRHEQQTKVIVVEAAVLLEADWTEMVDRLWLATVPIEVAWQRLMKRNELTLEEAQRRTASQMSPTERIEKANAVCERRQLPPPVVINSDGPFESTRAQIESAWKQLLKEL
jgi:dephospho-CoA kinase